MTAKPIPEGASTVAETPCLAANILDARDIRCGGYTGRAPMAAGQRVRGRLRRQLRSHLVDEMG